jgi:hypothetical protein
MTSITKDNITKPQSAFQYYLKDWKNVSDTDKARYVAMARLDKERYEKELLEKELEQEEKIREKEIYLRAYAGGYSSCGLDNGAKSYETVGPVVNIIEYSEDEQKKWGVKVKSFEFRDENSLSKWSLHHNQKYHTRTQWGDPNKKGDNVYTYGKTYNYKKDRPYNPIKKFHIMKKKPEHLGITTQHYTSFNNDTWTTHH